MYPSTLVYLLLCKASLASASLVLNSHQRLYSYWLLSLPDKHLTKKILPINLRIGDGTLQLEKLPENNLAWPQNTRPTQYAQWLVWQITVDHTIDPEDGVKLVEIIQLDTNFSEKIFIDNKSQVLRKVKKDHADLII